MSTLVDAFSVIPPLRRWAMPQANSTTSWPRETSPSASESTLPCSEVMIAANSCLRALSSSRNANRICVRLAIEVSRHAGNAAAAASITVRASSVLASATSAVTAPVAGLVTGADVPLVPVKGLLSNQCGMTVMVMCSCDSVVFSSLSVHMCRGQRVSSQ